MLFPNDKACVNVHQRNFNFVKRSGPLHKKDFSQNSDQSDQT